MSSLPLVVLSNIIQFYLFAAGLFYLFLSLISLFAKRKVVSSIAVNKIAVVAAAYNEEKVIGFFIESVKNLNYPRELFSIYIIADNCSDRTAALARKEGVKVLEHNEKGLFQSKGLALKWGTKKILEDESYDAICYFDADTLAHPDFLKAMNNHLNSGEKVIQGRQIAKNKNAWLARILAVGHIISNVFFQSPKYALGLSATLHGKGMVFSRDIAEKYSWDETCLTEDLEIQMRLISDGVKITWAKDALLYDEEPVKISQYMNRAARWTRGSLDTARRHLFNLFKRAVLKGDMKAFEGALYCSGAYRFMIVLLGALLIYYTKDDFNMIIWFYKALPGSEAAFKAFNFAPLIAYPLAVIIFEKRDFNMAAAYFMQPVLGVLRLPVFINGIFKNAREWNKTEHESEVRIGDIIGNE